MLYTVYAPYYFFKIKFVCTKMFSEKKKKSPKHEFPNATGSKDLEKKIQVYPSNEG